MKQVYLHLHTRLTPDEERVLREGFGLAQQMKGNPLFSGVRNYADFTRLAILRLTAQLKAGEVE